MELQDEAIGMAISHRGKIMEMALDNSLAMRGSPIPCPEISASAAFCAYWFNVVPPSERPTFSAIATCKSVDAGEWRPPLSAPSPG